MNKQEGKRWIREKISEEAEANSIRIEVSAPKLWHVKPSEKTQEYTGPAYVGQAWVYFLSSSSSEKGDLGSIGFTDREVRFCETDCKQKVECRIRKAIKKIPATEASK